MWKDYIRDNKYLIGSISVVALGAVGILLYMNQPKPAEQGQLKEIAASGQLKETKVENKKVDRAGLIFDEKSEKASDGTPITQGDYNIDDIVQLAELKAEASQSDVKPTREQAAEQAQLNKQPVLFDDHEATVQKYDQVTVDVNAIVDGEHSYKRSRTSVIYKVGVKQENKDEYISNALIGAKFKEPFKKEITYPADYKFSPDLAGKTVEYEFIVQAIYRPEKPTDAEIDAIYKTMQESADYSNKLKSLNAVKQHVIADSKIKSYPAKVVKELRTEYDAFSFGLDYKNEEDFLEKTKTNAQEFHAGRSEYILNNIRKELVLQALSKKAGITMASEEFQKLDNENFNANERRDILYELVLTKLVQ